MIQSRDDYEFYLEADRISLGSPSGLPRLLLDEIWTYQRTLRKTELLINTNANPARILASRYKLRRQGVRLGFTIHPNNFGPGLSIAHHGTIVVNSGARIGANCRIHVGVNIGTKAGEKEEAPTIGDDCYIGPGAKLFGPIQIANNVAIGANAVVTKSFGEDNSTLVGIPAKKVSDSGSAGLLIPGSTLAQ